MSAIPQNIKTLMRLLEVPDYLRRSLVALMRLGRANADQVSLITKRARSVESQHLNQLVLMNMVKKSPGLRKMYFEIDYQAGGW